MSHKIFTFVPAFGQIISATTFLTTHALHDALSAKGVGGGWSTLSFPDIAELRSMAVSIWYDALDASHILFIDADMGFSPDLVMDMLVFGEPVVGTIYPQRRLPQSWAGSGTGEKMAERRGGFMRVEGVGMGCTLIHRSVITKMLEVFPEVVDTRLALHPAGETLRSAGCNRLIRVFDKIDIPERGQVSEDLSFCLRWNKCGGTVWAAIHHRISHVGPYDYAGCYLESISAPQQVAAMMPTIGGSTVVEAVDIAGAPLVQMPDRIEEPSAIKLLGANGSAGPPVHIPPESAPSLVPDAPSA
jgi:hypothetical protein